LIVRNLLIAAALAAFAATPAVARTLHHSHNVRVVEPHGPLVSSDVALRGGNVMGADPDPRVRFELSRDNPYY
jgi:hypothetical protein